MWPTHQCSEIFPVVLPPADLWYDSRFPRYCRPDFLSRAEDRGFAYSSSWMSMYQSWGSRDLEQWTISVAVQCTITTIPVQVDNNWVSNVDITNLNELVQKVKKCNRKVWQKAKWHFYTTNPNPKIKRKDVLTFQTGVKTFHNNAFTSLNKCAVKSPPVSPLYFFK